MMSVEYLPSGSLDCPLIRLFGFEPEDVARLRQLCEALGDRRANHVRLYEQPWVRPVDGFRLELSWDVKSSRVSKDPRDSVCRMVRRPEEWRDIVALLGPFEEGANGFHWLADGTEIRVLISTDGSW